MQEIQSVQMNGKSLHSKIVCSAFYPDANAIYLDCTELRKSDWSATPNWQVHSIVTSLKVLFGLGSWFLIQMEVL